MTTGMMMHPLEDRKSWELSLQRASGGGQEEGVEDEAPPEHRQLKRKHKGRHHRCRSHHHCHHKDDDGDDDGEEEDEEENEALDMAEGQNITNLTAVAARQQEVPKKLQIHQSKYNKRGLPPPDRETMQALMIDAGSQGTRIHIYEFERRILYTAEELTQALNGFKISLPTTNTRWTNRLKPGLDNLAFIPTDELLQQELIHYLGPLLDFARTVLSDKQDDWHRYPIYLKATGGLRTLPTPMRVRLINAVQELFQKNTTFNPFNFEDPERARVISGEEEAMYGWAAVNFAMGKLVKDTEGKGVVLNPHRTWGMLEMGGASTQIAWFQNDGDVMANLVKLQIGGARHWNIYAHSYLYFGVNGAWSRLNARLYKRGLNSTTINPCLPSHAEVNFTSWIHFDDQGRPLPRSDPHSTPYNVIMSNNKADFDSCSLLTRALLRKDANKDWVEFSHDGDCSFAGVYQPPLPKENSVDDEFIVTSNYNDVWMFLQLPSRAKVIQVQEGARRICNMNKRELEDYNFLSENPVKDDELYQFCFRATLTFEMLHIGYGFPLDYEIEAADVVNGQKLGWALGAVLYEINTLPWDFGGKFQLESESKKNSKNKKDHGGYSTTTSSSSKHHPHKKAEKPLFLGMSRPEGGGSSRFAVETPYIVAVTVGLVLGLAWVAVRRQVVTRSSTRRNRQDYQVIPSITSGCD